MCFLTPQAWKAFLKRDRLVGGLPIPAAMTGNGEFDPQPQTGAQRRVAAETARLAEQMGAPHGMDRRAFLRTSMGMAAAFLAMNAVYGPVFGVDAVQAADPEAAKDWAAGFADQLVFDDQVHFLHPGYSRTGLLNLRAYSSTANKWAPDEDTGFEKLMFMNFLKEVYLQSDTTVALLSGAPAEQKEDWFLPNEMKADARSVVNGLAGGQRLFHQAVINPGMPGFDEVFAKALTLEPLSWKGYSVGDPQVQSAFPYRLDDAKLMYPVYERMVRAGKTIFCVHKGLMPADYLTSYENWKYATVEDLPQAAKDWPQITFVIYHAAIRPGAKVDEAHLRAVEETGRIDWVSDLAEIPARHGVANVAADLGTVFGSSCVQHPRHAARILGELIKGLGEDNVYWGTDAVWHGSPQWQLEAFRRLEIPEDLQAKHGYAALGGPRSAVREKILGLNAARLYRQDPKALLEAARGDGLARMRSAYEADERSETAARALLSNGLMDLARA